MAETPATTPTTGAQPGQAAAGDNPGVQVLPGPGGQKVVPLEALEAVRTEKKNLAEELEKARTDHRMAEERISLYRATAANAAGAAPPPPPEKGPLDGMADDEVVTAADMKKLLGGLEGKIDSALARSAVEALPDYHALTNTHLRNVFNALPEADRPGMAQMIRDARNPRMAAYNLGKMDPAYRDKGKTPGITPDQQAEADRARLAANANKPGSVSAAVTSTGLSAGDYFNSMNDDQFDAEVQRVLRS